MNYEKRDNKQFDYENGNITFDEFVEQNYKYELYYKHALEIDEQYGTQHAQTIRNICRKRLSMKYNVATQITENGKRNVYGNYNDNNVMIEKTFAHLNSLKRSMSLSFQSDDENTRLFHENNMFRELLNLELSLRTMKKNMRNDNE